MRGEASSRSACESSAVEARDRLHIHLVLLLARAFVRSIPCAAEALVLIHVAKHAPLQDLLSYLHRLDHYGRERSLLVFSLARTLVRGEPSAFCTRVDLTVRTSKCVLLLLEALLARALMRVKPDTFHGFVRVAIRTSERLLA